MKSTDSQKTQKTPKATANNDKTKGKPKGAPSAIIMAERKDKDGKKSVTSHCTCYHKFTDADIPIIYEGLKKYHPMIAIVDKVGCSYAGLLDFIKRTPVLAEMKERAERGMVDIAIARLFESINMGNLNAIIYYLNCKARDRGFGEHQIIDANVNEKGGRRIIINAMTPERVAEAKRKCEERSKAAADKGIPTDKPKKEDNKPKDEQKPTVGGLF